MKNQIHTRYINYTALVLLVLSSFIILHAQERQLPNIIVIFSDDLGWGDVSSNNPESAYQTPSLDRMAAEGIRFTDGHAPATICSPSRYSLYSGNIVFRTGRGVRAFEGPGGPSFIPDGELTIGDMLKEKGYRTGVFGKWHVGLTWYDSNGDRLGGGFDNSKLIDYERSTPLEDGPNERGFDESYITPNCPTTDPLYVFIENGMVQTPADRTHDRDSLPNYDGRWRWDNDQGWMSPDYFFQGIDWLFLDKTREFINNHRTNHPDKPFFVTLSTQIAHAPVLPHPDLVGITGDAGARGDFVYELDSIVGEVMFTLDSLGIDSNTLIMFSADNGAETVHMMNMREFYDHDPAAGMRGMKRDGWEGGHRVPFQARWPGVIPAGQVTGQLANVTDIFATAASIVGYDLPDDAAKDSYDLLPVLLGIQPENEMVRDIMLTQSFRSEFQIRQGPWKYLDHEGSGGGNYSQGRMNDYFIDDPTNAPAQLYNLDSDPGEVSNLYFSNATKRQELQDLLQTARTGGRSAPTGRTPYPVTIGCMDPAYQEYDPDANFPGNGACQSLTSIKRPAQNWLTQTGLGFSITATGPHNLKVYNMAGELTALRNGQGPRVYRFTDIKDKGLYIVRIETRLGVEQKRMIIY